MNVRLERLAVVVQPEASIDYTVRRMASESHRVAYPGLAVVLDTDGRLQGVITDGDVRRAYATNIDWSRPVSDVMTRRPITISDEVPPEQIVPEVYRKVRASSHLSADAVRHVLVTDDLGRLVAIQDFMELLGEMEFRHRSVMIFGLGFVGLTVGVALANQGHVVIGVDTDTNLIDRLLRDEPHVYEPGLSEMLRVTRRRGNFTPTQNIGDRRCTVYIIAVGTSLDQNGQPNLSGVQAVSQLIAANLRRGDQVIVRSTVPVGTTRRVILPVLEKGSGLVGGQDFHLTNAPERTVTGQALGELRLLPQIVGGLTPRCTARGATFWTTLTPSVVQVPSLEAAELIKLANNAFRDLSFAFANELALMADDYNMNAFEIIAAANQGYPRNPIPYPSPGVGGSCLTKDPHLLVASVVAERKHPCLSTVGRRVNEIAARYPIEVVERFTARFGLSLDGLRILIIGLAFKGVPETNDVRASVSLEIAGWLRAAGVTVLAWDAVLGAAEIADLGIAPATNSRESFTGVDAVLILNNHQDNPSVIRWIEPDDTRTRLIFDGWAQLDRREIEAIPGLVYASMGYMTPPIPVTCD